ncbi:MAG TPA: class I SAM-dependent methyltransferase [Dehalococcoidia bacterium]|nr:class I SAM-dependent methyltransferase [Dehalococcoidia bacterium]
MAYDAYSSIADLYDFAYDEYGDDVDFYANLAEAVDGPLLELGVGSGRVAVPLAEAGFDVTGIDVSPSMLVRARARVTAAKPKGRIELVEADMTSFDLKRRFGLVFVAANTFQHLLTLEEQRACLARVAKHIEPGGIFALGVRSPATVSWEEAQGWAPLLLHWTRTDPETDDTIMKLCAEQPDPATMTRKLTYIYDRVSKDGGVRRAVFETELRYSTETELRLLLQEAGLRVTHVYGDYDLTPVGIGENLILVARAEAP